MARGQARARSSTGWIVGLGLTMTACGVDLGGADSTGTDGVYVYCQNEVPDDGGGVDDTGGGGGGGGGGPYDGNYWWVNCTNEPYDCLDPDVVCYTEPTEVAYCKRYSFPDVASTFPGIPICVRDGTPAPVDIINDWVSGEYPSIDAEIREACSDRCLSSNIVHEDVWTNQLPDLEPRCEDARWSPVNTGSWDPTKPTNCKSAANLNADDPDGSEIAWELVGGSSDPTPLSCDLTDDCADWFYPHVRAHIVAPGEAGLITPESRTARILAQDDGTAEIELDMPGSGSGVDDTIPLYGLAEYSSVDCGETVCPFFLANLTAYNSSDVLDVQLDTPTGRLNKQITNIQIDLVQSTLGIHNLDVDTVAFAPGALRLQVEFTVDSCSACSQFGNGTHVALVENQSVVFADHANSSLALEHVFPIQSGNATLSLGVDPVEYPPVAAHDLTPSETCDVPGGLVLDASHSVSTDPDNDIVDEVWWVDDIPCVHGCVMAPGTHSVSLEAVDGRGAVDRTIDRTVTVSRGSACSS